VQCFACIFAYLNLPRAPDLPDVVFYFPEKALMLNIFLCVFASTVIRDSVLTLLRSESPSCKCTKLHTVAASSNRDHPTRSLLSSPLARTINYLPGSQALVEVAHKYHSIGITLLLLVRATYIWMLFFAHIPLVVNRTFNERRGCNSTHRERPWIWTYGGIFSAADFWL